MKYAKPEVTLINSATVAIQEQLPKQGTVSDGSIGQNHFVTANAYEADE
jgi:hypothetical protein